MAKQKLLILLILLTQCPAAIGPQVIHHHSVSKTDHWQFILRNEFDQFINQPGAQIITSSIAINYTNARDDQSVIDFLKAAGATIQHHDGLYTLSGAFTIKGSDAVTESFPWCISCQKPQPDGFVGPAPCCVSSTHDDPVTQMNSLN
ncbi:MAG: hypothetical protein CMF46_02195 [Legionellales bacterium]|nr:hypothetical protein [Legionellales bacterium]|tara:strand:+ start:1619 stop:2059 length:441 start_codon:yes stop_codon:yes gene_type:complete